MPDNVIAPLARCFRRSFREPSAKSVDLLWQPLGSRTGRLLGAFLAIGFVPSALADTIEVGLPVACALNKTCFIQNYTDTDPTPGARDYRCGGATYDGHKGTDFRLLSVRDVRRNVAVLAAAPGRVKALRDGVPDRLTGKDAPTPVGRECGNGVVIDHGQGWETQYCHLRRGSISVRRGQLIKRGETLGLVGYSGKTEFAHLHFAVRRDGESVDPFTGRAPGGHCGDGLHKGLWLAGAAPHYDRGRLIEAGFTEAPVKADSLENGRADDRPVLRDSPAIVFYARFINLERGDRIFLVLKGPGGLVATSDGEPLNRHKAQYVAYVGKKLVAGRWPPGRYHGRVRLLRNNKAVRDEEFSLQLP